MLYNVLRAFCAYRSKYVPGYVQGMNFIAAFMLMHMPEENAFWMMTQVFDNPLYNFTHLYENKFAGLMEQSHVFTELLKQNYPAMHKAIVSELNFLIILLVRQGQYRLGPLCTAMVFDSILFDISIGYDCSACGQFFTARMACNSQVFITSVCCQTSRHFEHQTRRFDHGILQCFRFAAAVYNR